MACPEQYMSKKLMLFCFLSVTCTIFLLFGTPPPPDTLGGGPATKKPTYRGRYAITTFLASHDDGTHPVPDEQDPYFVSARTLLYQLLHSPNTKLRYDVPVIVAVTPDVRESKRRRLRADGATVVEIEYLANSGAVVDDSRSEMATKLRLFDPTIIPYEKALFMEPDMVLTRPILDIFGDPSTEPALINDTTKVSAELGTIPERYLMAASPDSLQRDHAYPFLDPDHTAKYFNGSLFMYSPTTEVFQYYKSLLSHPELYYTGAPGQDLINYAHRWGGPMPWKRLHSSWYINWPNDNDLAGNMALLHSKWWMTSSDAVEQFALARRWEMEGYWTGREANSRPWTK
jgi:alpha-N-acetylglucosamine transferase